MQSNITLSNFRVKNDSTLISRPTTVKFTPTEEYQIIQKAKHTSFPIYLCYFGPQKQLGILKYFPYDNRSQSIFYKRESRLTYLKHPNIVTLLSHEPKSETFEGKKCSPFSYVITKMPPFGTLTHLLAKGVISDDEVLARTYFQYFILALEYIHVRGLAHMDLKTDSIQIDDEYLSKIADFDSSVSKEDTFIHGRGTKNFRAPEVKSRICKDPQPADIYSAGIILFALRVGKLPYVEDITFDDYDLVDLLKKGSKEFWEAYGIYSKNNLELSDDFKELFMSMVAFDPKKRPTAKMVKESKWFQGKVYNKFELKMLMNHRMKVADIKDLLEQFK